MKTPSVACAVPIAPHPSSFGTNVVSHTPQTLSPPSLRPRTVIPFGKSKPAPTHPPAATAPFVDLERVRFRRPLPPVKMFETLVTGLLTNALGNYIDPKCFSSDKISFAIWGGRVVLKGLEVKPEVFADLPAVRLVRGVVGSIELNIPWNTLHSDSVVAIVDDVYLLVRTEEDVDAVMKAMDEFSLKKKLLEELYLQAKQQEEQSAEGGSDAANGEDGFAARLINKIIDNLENNDPRIFKIVELNHLSVYCNPDCEMLRERQVDFETCTLEEFSSIFNRSIPKRSDDRPYNHTHLYPSPQQHHFLLKPIDASAQLILNRDVFDASVPKFQVEVKVSEVALRLEESQYCDMLYLASALQIPDHYTKFQRYRNLRPLATVYDEPAEWWKYAIKAVMEDVKTKKQRWTWAYMKDRREDRKRYVTLWQQKSRQLLELNDVDYTVSDSEENDDSRNGDDGGDGNASVDDEQEKPASASSGDYTSLPQSTPLEIDFGLEEIERRRSVEDVLFFRYLADLNVRKFQASRDLRARRKLPTPPTHHSSAFSDTESVDTEVTESSVPAEVRYRSWGAWMFGWTSKLAAPSPDGDLGDTPRRVIPEVELRELFKILEEPSRRSKKRMHHQKHRDLDGNDDIADGDQSQGELSELFRVTVILQRGSFAVSSDPETNKTLLRDDPSYGRKYSPTDFLLGTFSQLQVAAVARDETVVVDVSLQSIDAYDESAESSSFSRLLSRKQTIRPGGDGDDTNVSKLSGAVFLMSCEMNPVNSNADASVVVHMEPLEIVLSPTARCWGRLAQFLDTPTALGLWAELEVASFNDIVNLKARTEAKLDYVMENRIALAVDLRIQAPVIIIPESDADYNCARLVVDLGRINFLTHRLSQMDSENMNLNASSAASLGRSGMGSLAVLSPSRSFNVNPNTSFVQQLYDEAERGEGAIRWKEEFYDKFSLSVTDIHVLLIPYGKTRRVQDEGLANEGMSYPSVSLPPYLLDMYDEEQKFELIERFNINVTIRMSILPLDATLTRFYVHADLPALTFNLSLEKYFQLIALADRFSVAAAEVPQTARKYSDSALFPREGVFGSAGVGAADFEDKYEAMRRDSFLSTSALKKFMLDGNEGAAVAPTTDALLDDTGDSDGNSSVESDDTWFSITSGNLDLSASPLSEEIAGDRERSLSISDLAEPGAATDGPSVNPAQRSAKKAKKRARFLTPGRTTKLLDRRLLVCSFTIPLISVQLKKPRSSTVASYASYRYDTSDFDEDPTDNGTVLVKLQGFRIRVGQKTLSTQVNVSLMSLEVEDYLDATGRSTQFLMFSCPTIAAPFSMKAPLHRGEKFPSYSAIRRRPNRQRERVISFQRGGPRGNGGPGSRANQPPETLLELVFSSLNDQKSGKEVLQDVDVQLGSVQFNFDQSYVCSLLELFEESSSQSALVPAPPRDVTGEETVATDFQDGAPPPFELTPSINQEYSMSVNLTESVRADLERARKNFLEHAAEPDVSSNPTNAGASQPLPVMLKLGVRLHSVSVCFSDRGESLASVAILNSQVQLGTAQAGQVNVTGLIGDIKVFDLSSKKSQDDGLGIGGTTGRGFEPSPADFIEIFGLDTSNTFVLPETPQNMLSVECSVFQDGTLRPSEDAASDGDKRSKSTLALSVQPVRLLAQPEFVESVSSYVLDGPLRAHFLLKRATANGDETKQGRRSRSVSFDSDFQLAPRSSPLADKTRPPEISTPFFDAVDTSNRDGRQLNFDVSSFEKTKSEDDNCDEDVGEQVNRIDDSAADADMDALLASVLDNFDLDVKLFHPCIVLPSTSLKDIRVSLLSQPSHGIVLDFGTISAALHGETSDEVHEAPGYLSRQVTLAVNDLQVRSLADQTAILDRSGFQMRCVIPTQTVKETPSGDEGLEEPPEIALSVEIYPVCLNVSETNVCLALEVYYEAISPMLETFQEVIRQMESYEGASLFDSASARGGDLKEGGGTSMPVPVSALNDTMDWGRMIISCVLEEFKIAFLSYSEAPHQFETWMKSVIDLPDEISSRESSGGASSATQGRYYPQHFMGRRGSFPNEIPCCVIGEISFVALETHLVLDLQGAVPSGGDIPLECDFSLREAVIRDKIADETVCWNLEPRASISSESSSFSLFSREDLLPPLLRPSTSQSSRLDVASSQLSGRLVVKPGEVMEDGPEHAISTNSLDVSVSSARFVLLPRTLLRLEHFALDVFLAANKKIGDLESRRDEAMVNNPPGVESSAYVDAGVDLDDSRGDRPETRFGVPPLRSRNDSISESLKDELNVVRAAFMSPLQRMLSTASAKDGRAPPSYTSRAIVEETGSGTSQATGSKVAGASTHAEANREWLRIPKWIVDARFSNLQLWVVSTDRRADATGCVLSSQLVAKFDSALCEIGTAASPDQCEFVAATARLSRVEVRVGSPLGNGLRPNTPESPAKTAYFPGTLVEDFDVDLQVKLYQCFRPVLVESIDPESNDENSEGDSDETSGKSGDQGSEENSDDHASSVPWIDTSGGPSTGNSSEDAPALPELFLREIPSEWQEWVLNEPTVRINQITSHVSYRDLPLLLKISASLTGMLGAEQKVRDTFVARLKAASDDLDLDWSDMPDTPGEYSEYAHYFDTDDVDAEDSTAGRDALLAAQAHDILTRASVHASGLKFRLINNIVDQESPVVEFDTKAIEVLLRSESKSMVELAASCRAEAQYQNLRLVTMEPLLEPWSVAVTLSQQQHVGADEAEPPVLSPWKLNITSDVFLQLNLTDAFIANLMAANRAWRWVVNAGGDSREMTEYSTYWIRNNTGLPLRYWGASYKEHSLAPGQEEPLRFNSEHGGSEGEDEHDKSRNRGRRNAYVRDRQLFIAVEEEYPSDNLSNIPRKWQSEAPIPVDQVDSRMYALVDFEADITSTRMRKCECVIDVLVERGCKFFVVRSTLLLENQTSSDLEIEFVP
ncbi:hypothetical protein BBJ28_00015812, partial [Nothophytophthora sp. Chile5]